MNRIYERIRNEKVKPIYLVLLLGALILGVCSNAHQISSLRLNNVTKLEIINTDATKHEERLVTLENTVTNLTYAPRDIIRSNVHIEVDEGGGSGSVIKIDNKGTYILTAAHVVLNITRNDSKLNFGKPKKLIKVVTWNKKRYSATVIKSDSTNDLAVLFIRGRLRIKPVPIAKEIPKEGETVWHVANPGPYTGLINRGVVSKVHKNSITVSVAGFFGSSGGMVLNTRGEQIGVISTVNLATIGRFSPTLTVYNGITRTDKLNKFLKGIIK